MVCARNDPTVSSACLSVHRVVAAAYSLEDWGGQQRYGFNAVVTEQDEVDTYLVAFGAGVQDGRASSLMCSYNAGACLHVALAHSS
jgi:hypothetical protein